MPLARSYRSSLRKSRLMGTRRPRRPRRKFRRRPMTTGRVKRIIDAELKVADLSVENVPIPSVGGTINQLTIIGQGDTNTQRTGNWIKPTSFMGTIVLKGNPAADPDVVPEFRVGVFCWKENQNLNGASIDKIMQDDVDPHQGFNIENKGQFKILWSRTGILSNQNRNPHFQKILKFYVKPPLKVLYDNALSKNNHLFIFAYTGTDTLANPPTINYSTRIRYTDS